MISKQVARNVVSHVMHANERTNEDAMQQYLNSTSKTRSSQLTQYFAWYYKLTRCKPRPALEKASVIIIPEEVFSVLGKEVREGE